MIRVLRSRQPIATELITEDRLAAKIIDDMEVFCVNKLCDWKDKLELLESHVKVCPFDKDLPNWIKELKAGSPMKSEDNGGNENIVYGTEDDALIEKLNLEIPKGNLTERLIVTDNKNLQALKIIVTKSDSRSAREEGCNQENKEIEENIKTINTLESVFLVDSDDEEKHTQSSQNDKGNIDQITEQGETQDINKVKLGSDAKSINSGIIDSNMQHEQKDNGE